MRFYRRLGLISFLVSLASHAGLIGISGYLSNSQFSNGRGGLHEVELLADIPSRSAVPQLHQHPTTKAKRLVPKRDNLSIPLEKTDAAHSISTEASAATSSDKVTDGTAAAMDARTYGEEEVDVPAQLMSQPKLRYPKQAYREGIEGSVVVYLVVNSSGKVTQAEITRGVGNGFDEAALIAARELHFVSARKDGQPVSVHVHWTCHFRIDD